MNELELIAKQQLEIEVLKKDLEVHKELEDDLYNIIYCIGGPLNDNKLQYSKEQLSTFANISHIFGF